MTTIKSKTFTKIRLTNIGRYSIITADKTAVIIVVYRKGNPMNIRKNVKILTIAGLLSALGIIIPMFAPKLPLPPASFTLASHVPIFIAMFISPVVALLVALTTTLGFFITSSPIIALRAFTHIIFALLGAYAIKKYPSIMQSKQKFIFFAVVISIIHAFAEVVVVTYFYFYKGTDISELFHQKGYLFTVVLLVGVGGFIHSLVDFAIAVFVWKPIKKVVTLID